MVWATAEKCSQVPGSCDGLGPTCTLSSKTLEWDLGSDCKGLPRAMGELPQS